MINEIIYETYLLRVKYICVYTCDILCQQNRTWISMLGRKIKRPKSRDQEKTNERVIGVK